jgi:hypothetical protein
MVVCFTRSNGDLPATGLALADIALYLTRIHRVTGAQALVLNGANPTAEVANTGGYMRIVTTADLDTYNYVGGGLYTGLVALDNDWVVGECGITEPPVGTAIEYTYTVTNSLTGVPIQGVEVWVSTDTSMGNVVWHGHTDAFGVARDIYDWLPRLDAGTYYFFKQKPGFFDADTPYDTEVVS